MAEKITAGLALLAFIGVAACSAEPPPSPLVGATVMLKTPMVVCQSPDIIRHIENTPQDPDLAGTYAARRACKKYWPDDGEWLVEDVGPVVARVRQTNTVTSSYASAKQLVANVTVKTAAK